MTEKNAVTARQVLESTRTDRADGYDWNVKFRFTYADGTVSDWTISGTLSRRADGIDWHTDFDIENPPRGATPARQVRSIDTRITYADASPDAQGKRSATVDMTVVHGDGQQRTRTTNRQVSGSTVEPSLAEMLASVTTDPKVSLPFPEIRKNNPGENPGGVQVVEPRLPFWFCEESCASGCFEFIELPIGYAACVSACMGVCLAD